MRIREVEQKAENLIEQGEYAKRELEYFQEQMFSARSELASAYAMLDAASQTDEDGHPAGDVAYARAQVAAAQMQVSFCESGIRKATSTIEQINVQKNDSIRAIDRYTAGESRNLGIVEQLQVRAFGSNVNGFIADLLARMNAGEQAKTKLLQSMGISAMSAQYSQRATGTADAKSFIPPVISAGQGRLSYGIPLSGYFSGNYVESEQRKYDYINEIWGILNNPNLKEHDRSERLIRARESFYNSITSTKEIVDTSPVKVKKATQGDTFTIGSNSHHSAAMINDQALDDYLSQVCNILNNDELTKPERIALLRNAKNEYQYTSSDILIGHNMEVGKEINNSIGSENEYDYRGINTTFNSVIVPSCGYAEKNTSTEIRKHPRYSGMIEFNGRRANVFSMNDARLNKLTYSQGNNKYGWKRTCGITQCSNTFTKAGIEKSEDYLAQSSKRNGLCDKSHIMRKDLNGGTTPPDLAAILSINGLNAHYDYNLTESDVANLVENGHGVIVGVNAGYLWNQSKAIEDGGANHAISIIGTVRDERSNELLGVFINDTGRSDKNDQKRLISMETFRGIFRVPRSAVIATDNPIS